MWEEMKGRLLVKGDCNGKQCCINRCSIFDGVVFGESFDMHGAENLVIWCSEFISTENKVEIHNSGLPLVAVEPACGITNNLLRLEYGG